MRASRSSRMCWIFVFHRAGMIWRTGTLGRVVGAQAPLGRQRDGLLGCCDIPKALLGPVLLPLRTLGLAVCSIRAGAINQWSGSPFRASGLTPPSFFWAPEPPRLHGG